MDLRSSSGGVEPKIRQIGFFTQTPPLRAPPSRGHGPGAVNELGGDSGVAPGAGRPPLHHADHLPPGLPSPAMIDAVLATSAPVRSSARLPSQSCRLMRKGETTHNIIQLRKQAECWRICRNCWRLHAGGGLLMCWLAQVMKQKNKVNLQLSLLFGLQAQHIWTPSNYALMMTEWIKESGEQLAMLSGFSVA